MSKNSCLHQNPQSISQLLKLFSIADGVTGDERINCDEAEYVGKEAMEKIVGNSYGEITLR